MVLVPSALPLVCIDLPGTGGRIRVRDGDFRVEELAAYEPEGVGDHVFASIEKRDLTTHEATRRLAHALGGDSRDVGTAGLKDRHAITTQWMSFPPPCTPEALLALEVEGVRVLSAARHPHKLRTGHLRGNRFSICIRDVEVDSNQAAARASRVLECLSRPPGCPNWFGEQRFGARGDTASTGRTLVRGEPLPANVSTPRGRMRRLFVSAYQSLLFNEILKRRIEDDLYRRVVPGDLMQKTDSRGVFASTDTAVDQARMDRGEIVPTGPMFGHKMKTPPVGTEAANREQSVLDVEHLTLQAFKRVGKLARGTRRAMGFDPANPAVRAVGERAIEVQFELPAGSYATAVIHEIVKASQPEQRTTPC